MPPQPAKKQKTEDEPKAAVEGEEEPKAEEAVESEKPKEPEKPKELEDDAQEDNKRPKIEAQVAFRVEDTTINTMPSTFGNMLMPLTDGGLQFLLAGARANVGIKAGRYMFEVKVMEVMNPAEDSAARQKIPLTRNQIRIGFSTAGGSLFLGETASSVCFDTEGAFIHDKTRTVCSQKFGCSDVVAIVLNLDNTSPNSNTVSLFKNGERACQPQPLPEDLIGKLLYPAVTFKSLPLHYNFGPEPLIPLPFVCRMAASAATSRKMRMTLRGLDWNIKLAPAVSSNPDVVAWSHGEGRTALMEESHAKVTSDTDQAVNALQCRIGVTVKDLTAKQESLHTTRNSLSDCSNEVAVVRSDLLRTIADAEAWLLEDIRQKQQEAFEKGVPCPRCSRRFHSACAGQFGISQRMIRDGCRAARDERLL